MYLYQKDKRSAYVPYKDTLSAFLFLYSSPFFLCFKRSNDTFALEPQMCAKESSVTLKLASLLGNTVCGRFIIQLGNTVCGRFIIQLGNTACGRFIIQLGNIVCGRFIIQLGNTVCGRFIIQLGNTVCGRFITQLGNTVCGRFII
jgi:hypothetical protein